MPQKTLPLPKPKSKPQNRPPKSQKSSKEISHPTSNLPKKQPIPFSIQQAILTTFSTSFPALLSSSQAEIQSTIQTVKSHLYARDFNTAFGTPKFLEAYAYRWSPARALAYTELFLGVEELRSVLVSDGKLEIVCLGGGAGAEFVALAGCLGGLDVERRRKVQEVGEGLKDGKWIVHLVDIAGWGEVIEALVATISSVQPTALLRSKDMLSVQWWQQDLLSPMDEGGTTFLEKQVPEAKLVTMMFTLNELYCSSMSKTTAFLLRLTAVVRKGTVLLVVDSPGSYSTVKMGMEEKKYPMRWLLDHTLLEAASLEQYDDNAKVGLKGKIKQWEKIVEDESKWFRRLKGLEYPIELEDMRYQIHVYRRI